MQFYSTVELCSEQKDGSNLEAFGPNSRCFVNSLASIGSIDGFVALFVGPTFVLLVLTSIAATTRL